MKVIDTKSETGTNNAQIKRYILDIGYTMTDITYDNGETVSVLTTKKGKDVKVDSVTYKRAEKAVDKFANSASRSKL